MAPDWLRLGTLRSSLHRALEQATAMLLGHVAPSGVDSDGDLEIVITDGHYQPTSHPAPVSLDDGGALAGVSGIAATPWEFTLRGQALPSFAPSVSSPAIVVAHRESW